MEPSGAASFWSRTARINVRLSTGEDKSFFFKVGLPSDMSLSLCLRLNHDLCSLCTMKGGISWQKANTNHCMLYTVAPDMVPEPLGWGTLEANPDGHFFLCEFVNLADEIPDPSLVCKKLAELHRKSITMSPNGMYGFEMTTCNGTFPQDNTWNDSWEAFFIQQMDGAFKAEEEVHGSCEDYRRLLPPLFEKVIPRLLRPLETSENSLKPALVHGKDTLVEHLRRTDGYSRGSLGRQCVIPCRD